MSTNPGADGLAVVEPGPITDDGRQTWSARCDRCGTRIGGVTRKVAQAWQHGHDIAGARHVEADERPQIQCWFCTQPAVTIGYGFAVCGGREETPINCSERARDLFSRSVAEAG